MEIFHLKLRSRKRVTCDPGTYWITAIIDPVDGELDTDDNVCTSLSSVTVSVPAGGEVTAFSTLAIILALRSLLSHVIPLITLTTIMAAASTLIAYALHRKKRRRYLPTTFLPPDRENLKQTRRN